MRGVPDPMLAVYSDDNALHDPDHFISRGVKIAVRELPERANQLLAALRDGAHEIRTPRDFGRDALLSVHDPRYIHFLANAYDNWQTLPEPRGPFVLANSYAMRQMKTLPTSFEGQLGFFLSGNSVPIGPHELARDRFFGELRAGSGGRRAQRRVRKLRAVPPARPPRLCRSGRRLLLPEQLGARGPAPARPVRPRRGARRRRAPRQRHAGHLLGTRRRPDRLDPWRSQYRLSLAGRLCRRTRRGRGVRQEPQSAAAARHNGRALSGGAGPRARSGQGV